MVKVRTARAEELAWVNERYREIDFVPSSAGDYIAVAEVDGERAGLGRIVALDDSAGELGGMYVFQRFRRSGVARAIVAHLLKEAGRENLYCLPFAELKALYASFGFRDEPESGRLPATLVEKYRWCNRHYPKPVLLLKWAPGGRIE